MIRTIIFICFLIPLTCSGQVGDSTVRKTSFAIYPALAYAPETKLVYGVVGLMTLKSIDESQNVYFRQSTFSPVVAYTARDQFLTVLTLEYYRKNGHNLNVAPQFFNYPDFYFGIGNATQPNVSELYTNVFTQIAGQYFIPSNVNTFLGVAFDLNFVNLKDVEAEGMLAADRPIGFNGGSIFGIGPAIRRDTRNNTIYPTRGNLFNYQSLFAMGDFSYSEHRFNFRKYLSADDKNIFAIQALAVLTTGAPPFFRLPRLGGAEQLRGIANASLYRDRQLVLTQVEYRRPLVWRFGMVAFTGAGNVVSNFSEFETADIKVVGGLGLRFQVFPDEKLNLRFDYGVSQSGQSAIYFGLREAF